MAHIVKTYELSNCTVHIADDFYTDKTEQELEAIKENARRTAWSIIDSAEAKKSKGLAV